VLFAVIIAVPAIGYWRFDWNPVFSFWAAYVITRPLGASFADWLGKPVVVGGLGWGNGKVSLGLTVLIIASSPISPSRASTWPGARDSGPLRPELGLEPQLRTESSGPASSNP